MKRKTTTALIISGVALIIIAVIFYVIQAIIPMNYESAKKKTENFLCSNIEELEKIAIQSMESKSSTEKEYKKADSIYYDSVENTVVFETDSQGMLGGQFWSLIYTENGTFRGESKQYIYKEENGNNIIIAEHLQGNWFFYWIDYDGREDLSSNF